MAYRLKLDDYCKLWELTGEWSECIVNIAEGKFDFKAFQLAAQKTYRWLEKYKDATSIPIGIVSLLMDIKDFVNTASRGINRELDVVRDVADALCEADFGFSICSDSRLFVKGASCYGYIDPNTFDMTHLIEDKDM